MCLKIVALHKWCSLPFLKNSFPFSFSSRAFCGSSLASRSSSACCFFTWKYRFQLVFIRRVCMQKRQPSKEWGLANCHVKVNTCSQIWGTSCTVFATAGLRCSDSDLFKYLRQSSSFSILRYALPILARALCANKQQQVTNLTYT